jgi:hypothetical protein
MTINETMDVLDELREYHPDVSEKYVIDRAIAEIVRLRAALDPDGALAEFDRNKAKAQ